MALSINPAVCRDRIEWVSAVWLFGVGVWLSAMGVALAAIGVFGALSLVVGRTGYVILASLAVALACARDLGVNLPLPYRRGQVPEVFRDTFGVRGFSFVFGLQLGAGFLTHFTTSFHMLMVVTVPLVTSAVGIPLAVAAFALGKLVMVLAAGKCDSLDDIESCLPNGLAHTRFMHVSVGLASFAIATVILVGLPKTFDPKITHL